MTVTTPLGQVLRDDEGMRLEFVRTYPDPIEDVWSALTEPDRVARWFGLWSGDPDHFNSDMGGPENLWHQDRQAMAEGHWSGITGRGNAYEDFAVQESMGAIVDRSQQVDQVSHRDLRAPAPRRRPARSVPGRGSRCCGRARRTAGARVVRPRRVARDTGATA